MTTLLDEQLRTITRHAFVLLDDLCIAAAILVIISLGIVPSLLQWALAT